MAPTRRVTVLGDGGWGSCLAVLLGGLGHRVTLWGAFPEYVEQVRETRESAKFLPGVPIPPSVELTSDLRQALESPEVTVIAVPSQYLRSVLPRCAEGPWDRTLAVSVVKGIEPETLLRMSELIRSVLPVRRLAVLSGPSISYEVARGEPAAVVAASEDPAPAREVQELFSSGRFRVYTSADVTGVELGGSLKNVVAIACGAADGMGFGVNTKAALVSRGLAEMARLGAAMGARPETFFGLSGLGDLVTTCFSPRSRNRTTGERLAKGETLESVLGATPQVSEGVATAKSAHALSEKHRVEMPIVTAVYQVLHQGQSLKERVENLMLRGPKQE